MQSKLKFTMVFHSSKPSSCLILLVVLSLLSTMYSRSVFQRFRLVSLLWLTSTVAGTQANPSRDGTQISSQSRIPAFPRSFQRLTNLVFPFPSNEEDLQTNEDEAVVVTLNRSANVLLELFPFDEILDTAQVTALEESLSAFYDQIFDSQTDYDLQIQETIIGEEQMLQPAKEDFAVGKSSSSSLRLRMMTNVHFRPTPEQQEQEEGVLSNEELEHILIRLLNRFQSNVTNQLKSLTGEANSVWQKLETISASGTDKERNRNDDSDSSTQTWTIIITSCACAVAIVATATLCCLYRHELQGSSFIFQRLRKTLPTTDDPQDETHDMEKHEEPLNHHSPEGSSQRTIFLGDSRDSVSSSSSCSTTGLSSSMPTATDSTPLTTPPAVPRFDHVFSHSAHSPEPLSPQDRANLILRDEDYQEGMALPMVYSRRVIWAPPGKLGVAMDVIDGYTVVYSVKKGSPLEEFLRPMDRIMAIDEVDTWKMSAADVTQVMVSRMDRRRQITYERGLNQTK